MSAKHRTPTEQRRWDELYHDLVLDCVRREGFRKAMACLSLARDVADAALTQRRESINADRK